MVGSFLDTNPKAILSGFINLFFSKSHPILRALATHRMKSCSDCPFRKEISCGKCGCYLKAKVVTYETTCPEKKWGRGKFDEAGNLYDELTKEVIYNDDTKN